MYLLDSRCKLYNIRPQRTFGQHLMLGLLIFMQLLMASVISWLLVCRSFRFDVSFVECLGVRMISIDDNEGYALKLKDIINLRREGVALRTVVTKRARRECLSYCNNIWMLHLRPNLDRSKRRLLCQAIIFKHATQYLNRSTLFGNTHSQSFSKHMECHPKS